MTLPLADEKRLFTADRPQSDAISLIYAFPNTYSVGITSLGYQSIWAQLAQRPDVDVRRWFIDGHEPLPRQPEWVGFSFSWELDYAYILRALDRLGIPRHSDERPEGGPLVFGGGPVLTANPEPYAVWFDVVLLGDGEDLLGQFLQAYQEVRRAPREAQRRHLAQVPGVYVPALYTVTYESPTGPVQRIEPQVGVPPTVTKQTYRGNTLTVSTVVTPHAAWENIFMVEVVRSCPEMCRFCLASYLTLPFRTADVQQGLMPAIERGLQYTDRLGLLGASISQHPEFAELVHWLQADRWEGVRLSLASVRTNTLTRELCAVLAKRDSRSVTVAIESGSERLRQIINKKLSNEEICTAVDHAQAGGLKAIKFYGMVGVPDETPGDVQATVDLLKSLKKQAPRLQIGFGCSTFVPKAHTPWQWCAVDPKAETKLKELRKRLAPIGIDFRPESYNDSVIQAVLSRGDRRLHRLLERTYEIAQEQGDEVPSAGTYRRAFKELRGELPPLDFYVFTEWPEDRPTPWHHLQGPLPLATLVKHRAQSRAIAAAVPC
ncbi:MAG: radical SAM protein [Pseudanabaenaceae cyanobacterium]